MTPKEAKRLVWLQEGAGKNYPTPITYPDLLLLLRHDPALKALLQEDASDTDDIETCTTDVPHVSVEDDAKTGLTSEVVPVVASQPELDSGLSAERFLLDKVCTDAELSALWSPDRTEPTARKLVRLIALAAQWERVLQLWDMLAARCRQQQRAVTPDELAILNGCLALHNLIWQGRQARLDQVVSGEAYDYRRHERGTPQGECIRAQWLPGLLNAAGQLQKKTLVET